MRRLSILLLLAVCATLDAAEKYMSDGPMLTGSKPLTPAVSEEQRFYLHGDVRYRLQYIDRDADGSDFLHRLRVRFGVDARVNEKMFAEIQLASGSGDPVSTNQSLGDGFTTKDIRLDIGDIYYNGAATGTAIVAGLWIGSNETTSDVYFYNLQAVQRLETGDARLTFAAAYYGVPNLKNNVSTELAGRDRSNGNSVVDINGTAYYACNYEMVDAFVQADLDPFSLSYEAVLNTAVSRGNFGYNVGALYKEKALSNLKLGYFYRLTEADAVIGAFHDSDFMGGNTNSLGNQFMAGVDLMKNTQFALTYIDGWIRNGYNSGADERYRRLHLDVMVTFD